MIRVAVVDDQRLIVDGIASMVRTDPGMDVVVEGDDGQVLLDAVAAGVAVDVALVDARMPGVDGVEVTRRLRGRPGAPRVVIVTTFDEDELVIEAIAAGAAGFLLKRSTADELLAAVRTVAAGQSLLDPRVAGAAMGWIRSSQSAPPARPTSPDGADRHRLERLSERESEVLACMADGLTNPEIASALSLSVSTVKSHVASILAKTDSRDRMEAVLLALRGAGRRGRGVGGEVTPRGLGARAGSR